MGNLVGLGERDARRETGIESELKARYIAGKRPGIWYRCERITVRSRVYPIRVHTLTRKEHVMSENTLTARKYSSKGIASAPKNFRTYKSSVNKLLWRKYHATRATLGIEIADVKLAYNAGISAHDFVRNVVA